jgi:hypothetical protein
MLLARQLLPSVSGHDGQTKQSTAYIYLVVAQFVKTREWVSITMVSVPTCPSFQGSKFYLVFFLTGYFTVIWRSFSLSNNNRSNSG